MKKLQMYETTIMADTSEHAAHLVVLSSRYVSEYDANTHISSLLLDLGMRKITEVSASNLSRCLAILLSGAVLTDEFEKLLISASSGQIEVREGMTVVAASDLRFAEIVVFDDVVPIEQSPLKAEALVTLVTKATGAGLGAFAGFVAFGDSPLLLITVPAGMIICGAAKGIADALESGLRDRLFELLKGKRKTKKHPN